MVVIILLFSYWIFCSFFGNDLIQLKLFGVPTFYMFMGIGLLLFFVMLLNYKGLPRSVFVNNKNCSKWLKSIVCFIALSLVYLVLSFFNFFSSVFSIDAEYKAEYVFRHGYLAFTFPIIFVLIILMSKNKDRLSRIIKNNKMMFALWLFVFVGKFLIGFDVRTYRSVLLFFASLIFFNNPKKPYSYVVLGLSIMWGSNIEQSSTTVLGLLLAFLFTLCGRTIYVFFHRFIGLKMYVVIGLVSALVYLLFNGIIMLNDPNTMWRVQYWAYEFQTLAKTMFIGVGYGVAYASPNCLSGINNPYVFLDQAEEGTGIWVITQHSSLMNSFYRLGLVGALLTVSIFIIEPIRWIFMVEKNKEFRNDSLIKWASFNFVFNLSVILTNPGLESPPFYIGFVYSYAVLFAVLLHNTNEKMKHIGRAFV